MRVVRAGSRSVRARRFARALASVLTTAAAFGAARADAQGPPAGNAVTVSVLTFGPGAEIFERFGHNAIRVRQPGTGLDVAFNWGMFSFEQPRFIQRFLTGETRYWMQGFNGAAFIEDYRSQHREVWEQELALTAAQKDSLVKILDFTQREENRYYRYDYYLDNCSTRVRDALDAVLGGAIAASASTRAHGVSFRSETLRLAERFTALNLGMDFVLGRRADEPLSGTQELFVPMRLRDLLREVRVPGADGRPVPLVLAEQQLVRDTTFIEPARAPAMWRVALPLAIVALALFAGLARAARTSSAARWTFTVLMSLWQLKIGLVGLLLVAAGLFTRHAYMGANLNVMLATPIALGLAVLLPLATRAGASSRLGIAVRRLAQLAAVSAAVMVVVTAVGPFAQHNASAIVLLLPVHLLLAYLAPALYPASERA